MTNVSPVCGSCDRVSALEVGVAIGKRKQGKSSGPTGVSGRDAQGFGRNWYVVDD